MLRRLTMAPSVTKILVPTDFSESADAALAYAKTLAGCLGASLHLLHVFNDPYGPALYAPEVYVAVPEEARERAIEEARARLAERLDADEETYFRGTRAIVTGLTAKQIVSYAADHGIGLIVMGTHGRRGVAHLLLGSVAEHVVRTAPCPVLTVRGTVKEEKRSTAASAAEQVA
jgi:nucleotide-binding universal stress UspA family protein